VADVHLETGNGVINLQWKTPAGTDHVKVVRDLQEPMDHLHGMPLSPTGAGQLIDKGLENGIRYFYRICCAYRIPNGAVIYSSGVVASGDPTLPPDSISNFRVKREGNEVKCIWDAPRHGAGVVLRSCNPTVLAAGQIIPLTDLGKHGKEIKMGNTPQEALDRAPDVNEPCYSLFSRAGSNAKYIETRKCAVNADVDNLSLACTQDGVILRWSWPKDCSSVKIGRRLNTWPMNDTDPAAEFFNMSLSDYQSCGEMFVDRMDKTHKGHYH